MSAASIVLHDNILSIAFKVVAHLSCIEYLVEERGYTCKPTFRMARQRLKGGNSSVCVCMCVCACVRVCVHVPTDPQMVDSSPDYWFIIHIARTKASFLVKKKWGDKCNACQRGFSRNYGFSVGRDQVAVVCSWCKDAESGD